MKKYLLVCGINYPNSNFPLNGCINDAIRVKKILGKNNFSEIVTLRDDKPNKMPTKERILNEMKNLLEKAQSGDRVIFDISCHGIYFKDQNGDEEDGKDEALCPCDYEKGNFILDDDLHIFIDKYLKQGTILTCFFDCCHSGTMLDLRCNYRFRPSRGNKRQCIKVNIGKKGMEKDVILFSGCLDSQESADAYLERQSIGAMTHTWTSIYEKNENITLEELLYKCNEDLIRKGFKQRPQISSSKILDLDLKLSSRL